MAGILQMLLAGGDRLRIDAATYSRDNPGAATAGWRIDSDGMVYVADDSSAGAFTARYPWIVPAANAANYDVRWSTVANAVDSTPGAEATNLNLGTDRQWSETNNAAFETCTFQVRIHRAGDSANPIITANIVLEVDGSP